MSELAYNTIKTELGLWIRNPADIETIAEHLCPRQRIIITDMPVGDFVCDALTNTDNYRSKKYNYRNPYKTRNQAISAQAKFDTLAIVIPRVADIPINKLNKRFSHEYYHHILANEREINMIRTMWNEQLTPEIRAALVNGIMPGGAGGARGNGTQQFEIARSEFWRRMKETLQEVHLKKLIQDFSNLKSKLPQTEVDDTDIQEVDDTDIQEVDDTDIQEDTKTDLDTQLRGIVTEAIQNLNAIPTTAPIGGYYNWIRASIKHKVLPQPESDSDNKKTTDTGAYDHYPDEEIQNAVYPFLKFITEFLCDDGEKYYTEDSGLTTQKNAWESRSQNHFILISWHLGTEKLDTINLRTGKHRDAISNRPDFATLKKQAHDFIKENANADPELRNKLLDPTTTTQNVHKNQVVYELLYRALGSAKKNNTQSQRSNSWQTHHFKIILQQWIASLNEKQRVILIELVTADVEDDAPPDPLLKPFIIENEKLKVKKNIPIEVIQQFFRALWKSTSQT